MLLKKKIEEQLFKLMSGMKHEITVQTGEAETFIFNVRYNSMTKCTANIQIDIELSLL